MLTNIFLWCILQNKLKEGVKLRKAFTTSIDLDISDNFKKVCEDYDLKMNVVLEAFMKQFTNHDFKIEFGKSGIKLKIED